MSARNETCTLASIFFVRYQLVWFVFLQIYQSNVDVQHLPVACVQGDLDDWALELAGNAEAIWQDREQLEKEHLIGAFGSLLPDALRSIDQVWNRVLVRPKLLELLGREARSKIDAFEFRSSRPSRGPECIFCISISTKSTMKNLESSLAERKRTNL